MVAHRYYYLLVSLFLSASIVLQLHLCSAVSPDGLALLAFKAGVSADPSSALADWDEGDADPCLWPGVSCANISGFSYLRVVALSLPGRGLSGYIPSELGSLAFLRRLNLHTNLLSGPVPTQLSKATSLHSLFLYSNRLSGPFPSSLCSLPRLQNLDLSGNALSGAIPSDLAACSHLQRLLLSGNRFSGVVPSGIWPELGSLLQLDLSSNNLSGPIPPELGDLRSLSGTLNLSHNHFSGEIPRDLGNLPAAVGLDLRGNDLSGEIPQLGTLTNQGPTAFLGNPRLCGFPLQNPCDSPSPHASPGGGRIPAPRRPGGSGVSGGGGGQVPKKGLRPELIVLIAVGDAAGVAMIGLLLVYAYWKVKDGSQGCSCTGKTKLGGGRGGGSCFWRKGGGGGAACVGSPSSQSSSSEEEEEGGEGQLVAMDKEFSVELDELLRASAYVLGKSRMGIVYKVVVGNGVPVAVRRLGEGGGGGGQRRKEFAAEARAIGKVRHPNVVRLTAFYWSPNEKLLVCDFVPNGSLAAALRGQGRSSLTWRVRLRIARGTARGLAHIHECSPRKYVHGDVKPSNVLLHHDFTPLLSDFGLLRLITAAGGLAGGGLPFTASASSAVPDRPNGYRPPEARAPGGRPAQRWDVYSFGVLLLELLTGRSPESPSPSQAGPSSSSRPLPLLTSDAGEELVRWVRKGVEEGRPVSELVDPALLLTVSGAGEQKEIAAAFHVALGCTESDPELRPRMKTVSDNLGKIGSYS